MKIFIDIYFEKATQMEHWPGSRISMNIIVLYCIVYFYYSDIIVQNDGINMTTRSYPAHVGL